MKKFTQFAIASVLACCLVLGLSRPTLAAASSPDLGAAASFGILASTFTITTSTIINGDVGYTTAPVILPTINGALFVPKPSEPGSDQGIALVNLNAQGCDYNLVGDTDLSTLPQPLAPGKYCIVGAMTINTAPGITLSGAGTFIFSSTAAFGATAAGMNVTLTGGASACDVFWTPIGATTLGANNNFIGTVIDDAGITVGANTVWIGRALSFAETITTDTATITVPTCTASLATLNVIKSVDNTSGGTAVASDFILTVNSGGVFYASGLGSAGIAYTGLSTGTYSVIENVYPRYNSTFTGDCDASGNITLYGGYNKTCTVVNTYVAPATLNVIKTVVGGTGSASDFVLTVNSGGAFYASGLGSAGIAYTGLSAGAYTVDENIDSAYTKTFSGACNGTSSVTLAAGDDKTCEIINTYISSITTGTLHVIKTVVGGTGSSSDFVLTVSSGGAFYASGLGSAGIAYTGLLAGSYTVDEATNSSYTKTFSGACNGNSGVTLIAGDDKTCEIINTYISSITTGTLHVIKTVVGGSATASHFVLTVNSGGAFYASGLGVVSPGTSYTGLLAGSYTVDEAINSAYTKTFSGACNGNSGVTLIAGDNKACEIINTYITPSGPGGHPTLTPSIGILKVPTPLAISAKSGSVTYIYTVWNVAKNIVLTGVTVTDDKCSPVKFLTGDTNNNKKLDISEIWKYNCTTILSATTTNIVIAKAYGDNSDHKLTTATATATVVVGTSSIAGITGNYTASGVAIPHIHVVKTADRTTAFSFGGGHVIYTYRVTNPGKVALHDVTVTDDKCSSVNRISGDTNHDHLLNTVESRVYTCRAYVQTTTTNTATAKGEANGMTVRDYDSVTVKVSAPGLPKTGLMGTSWNIVMLASIFLLISTSVTVVLAKRKI